jgi:8-oxo-dGTP diphosphatase
MEVTKQKESHLEIYKRYNKLYIALDCIIFGFDEGELKLLLIKRNFEPAKGQWSLIGEFMDEAESLDEAAYRILSNLTGLKDVYMSQLYSHGDVNRDPGARVISVSYYSLINIQNHDAQLVKDNFAHWRPLSKLPPLIFDHSDMVDMALKRLRKEAKVKPIGFELLPQKFTLPQLQSLYEAIYSKSLDKRNFRKNMLSMGLLEKLDEKEKENSKKGAYYYQFNEQKYRELSAKGFYFNIAI